MVDILRVSVSQSFIHEAASWSQRREVVLSLDLSVHPGGVLSTEGIMHPLTSSLSIGSGPTKMQAVGLNYVQV